jgi:hypothetical protein
MIRRDIRAQTLRLFFYSKVVPVSLAMLVEGLVLLRVKNLGAIYKKPKNRILNKKKTKK